jgi:hypothetical protein
VPIFEPLRLANDEPEKNVIDRVAAAFHLITSAVAPVNASQRRTIAPQEAGSISEVSPQ